MIRGGTGGATTTRHGLRFEKRVSLASVLRKIPGYTVRKHAIYFNNTKIAEVFEKQEVYKHFLEPRGVNASSILSKRLYPDNAVFVLRKNTIFIIEIKSQAGPGSVDEKLQTCDFKLKEYNRLFGSTGVAVKYAYVLNNWFRKPEYADMRKYITDVGCDYFFNEIPLKYLGLPSP